MNRREKIVYAVLLMACVAGLCITQSSKCRTFSAEAPAYCAD